MAALNVRNVQSNRMELGKGGANSVGTIVAIVIFAVVAFVGLSSFFNDGGAVNPVILVIAGIVGIVLLSNLASALRATNVVLDAGQGTATRTDSLLFFPVRRQDMSLATVRDIRVVSPTLTGRTRANRMPVWQVQLQGSDGSTFVVNERGTRAEMDALAAQVSQLTNRPLYSASNPTGQAPATVPASNAPNGSRYSFIDNLASFAGAGTGTPVAPTFSAYPSPGGSTSGAKSKSNPQSPDAPYLQASAQLAAQQAAAGAQAMTTNARMTANQTAAGASSLQASAQLASQQIAAGAGDAAVNQQLAASQVAAGAPFAAASAQLAQQQAAGQAAMGYSLPPVLSMPQMPVLFSFAPPLDMPSFPPIGSPLQLQMTTLTEAPEFKQVQAKVTSSSGGSVRDLQRAISQDPQDFVAQYTLGRQLLSQRNWRDAQAALTRALGLNPSDAAAQNDLGVVYLEQSKLPDAERAFRRSMALDPFTSNSRYNLGLTLSRMGKRNEAAEQFKLGAQTGSPNDISRFQNAQQGSLGSPIVSPQEQIFQEASR